MAERAVFATLQVTYIYWDCLREGIEIATAPSTVVHKWRAASVCNLLGFARQVVDTKICAVGSDGSLLRTRI
jgi:hypothetical protein